MAWFARIDSPASSGPEVVYQPVNYYDDAVLDKDGLPSQVFSTTLQFPAVGTTLADVQKAVITAGQNARLASQRAAALKNAAPVGTTVLIP